MKKILLFLSHPENTFPWFAEMKISVSERDYYVEWQIKSFCEKKPFWNFTQSENVSYRRTFRILEKLGLVERMSGFLSSYKLTDKGKETAEKIEEEIRDLIEEYEFLVS